MKDTVTTPESSNTLARAKARRKIDGNIIAQMARLVARNLTESEAARVCQLEPRHWFEFKCRAGRAERWTALMESYRAQQIDHWLERMEQSADGKGGVKYPDWRSAARLLQFHDNRRFGDTPENSTPPIVNLQINVQAVLNKLRPVLPQPEPKQIADAVKAQ